MGLCQPSRETLDIPNERSRSSIIHRSQSQVREDQEPQYEQNAVIHFKFQSFNDAQFEQSIKSYETPQIKSMNLSWNQLTFLGMQNIVKCNWKNLIELKLWNNKIGDRGCKVLTKALLPVLQTLTLTENKVTSAGVIHLSKKKWTRLKRLDLSENKIGVEGLQYLGKIFFKKIEMIGLRQIKSANYFHISKAKVLFRLPTLKSYIT